ncbi:IS3 family transposase [Tannockella kyphosi]
MFSQSYQAYSYRRIHGELSNKKISISEKVVRKIMKEEV